VKILRDERRRFYSDTVISQIPRLLGMEDRDPYSPTYGCFDRPFWHYRYASDFPCSRFQEAALTLALLYKYEFPGNYLKGERRVLDWSIAAIEYWTEIQHNNGSFDEAYPNEFSFATAFSTYAIAEAYNVIGKDIPPSKRGPILDAMIRAARWLANHNDFSLTPVNQQIGALAAMHKVYRVTKEDSITPRIESKLSKIVERQSEEGWFMEYGGPDIGYLSLAIDYLAKYWKDSGDERVAPLLRRAIEFLSYFVHPNSTAGGEYASRNTEYLIPHGFEICTSISPKAVQIADKILRGIENKNITSPLTLDDRYFMYNHYTYLQAYLDYNSRPKRTSTTEQEEFKRYFPEAGILVGQNRKYYYVIGAKKGGVIRVYSRDTREMTFSDCGLRITLTKGEKATSQWLNSPKKILFSQDMTHISILGDLYIHQFPGISPTKMILLRLFSTTLGRSERLSLLLKKKLRERLVMKSEKTDIAYRREIELQADKIRIEDSIVSPNPIHISDFRVGEKFTSSFQSSSKYFQPQEVHATPNIMAKEVKKIYNIDITSIDLVTTLFPSSGEVRREIVRIK